MAKTNTPTIGPALRKEFGASELPANRLTQLREPGLLLLNSDMLSTENCLLEIAPISDIRAR